MTEIQKILSSADIDQALGAERAIIFKHSTRCGVSARANQVLQAYAPECEDGIEIYQVFVVEQRQLSDEITKRTGIEHHSPEVIFIRDATVTGFKTHFDIRPETLTDALT